MRYLTLTFSGAPWPVVGTTIYETSVCSLQPAASRRAEPPRPFRRDDASPGYCQRNAIIPLRDPTARFHPPPKPITIIALPLVPPPKEIPRPICEELSIAFGCLAGAPG